MFSKTLVLFVLFAALFAVAMAHRDFRPFGHHGGRHGYNYHGGHHGGHYGYPGGVGYPGGYMGGGYPYPPMGYPGYGR